MKTIVYLIISSLVLFVFVGMTFTGCNKSSSRHYADDSSATELGFTSESNTMLDHRAKHTVTPLPDGKILLTGGYRTSPHVSHVSAEIFDPMLKSFSLTGSMNDRRQCHNAVLLPDGTVLVVGGNNETDHSYKTAEIYDPNSGLFTRVGSMTEERTCAMSTLLPNGTVLVAGGYDTLGTYSDTAEIYDPATQTFSAPIQMHFARSCHAQVLMRNGLVLMTTGCAATENAELFNYRNNSFTVIDNLSTQRKYPYFELLPDGTVFIAGGAADGHHVATAEIYTPSYTGGKGSFKVVAGTLGTGRWRGAHGLLPDGKVLLMGGAAATSGGGSMHLNSAELYDPVANTFNGSYTMSLARGNWCRFVMTGYGFGVVFGGIDVMGESTNTYDIWKIRKPATAKFDALPSPMGDFRAKLTATLLPDGKILIAGGYKTSPSLSHATAEIYDPISGLIAPTGAMIDRRQCHNAVALTDGTVLLVGGNNETGTSLNSAEIYHPTTGQFLLTAGMTEARTCAMSTLLPNGKVLVAGGYDTAGTYSDTAEIYDPEFQTFSAPIQMHFARSCHAQVLMRNGLVLMSTGCAATENAELFDYRDNSFKVIDNLSTQRKYPFFELLPNGTVFITGGAANGFDVATAEIYTPSYSGGKGGFRLVAGTLGTGRWRGAHGLMPDGKVLLMGGATAVSGGGSIYLNSAEFFDPITESFSGSYTMSAARGNWPRFVLTGYGSGVVFGGIGLNNEATNSCDSWDSIYLK